MSQQPHDVDALAETELIPRFDVSIAEVLGGATAEPETAADPAGGPAAAAAAAATAATETARRRSADPEPARRRSAHPERERPQTAEQEPAWPQQTPDPVSESDPEPARPQPADPEPARHRSTHLEPEPEPEWPHSTDPEPARHRSAHPEPEPAWPQPQPQPQPRPDGKATEEKPADGKQAAAEEPADERRAAAASALQAAHADPTLWRETVPFDETGVLMRPESLRHKAMQAETELLSAVQTEARVDDGSEAAAAQRPGFWTGDWPRRALVAAILLVQALLSLRNNNTAFEDEALYLYSGHLELGHLLFGTSTGADFWSYFSGAPTLYPVLGSIADQIGGLFAARLLSLAFMLGTTGLLYLLSKRLFGTRAGLCAAGLYCCGEATVFLGGLATYDAPALFLLALAAWIVVRFAESTWPVYLIAAFPLTLAVGTKYAALIFVPVVIGLALLTSLPKSGAWALARPVALIAAVGCLLYTALKIAGPEALTGVEVTTTNRAQGTDPASLILKDSAEWGGVVFVASVVGAWFLMRLPRTDRHAALLAPAYQLHLHTAVSLQKHVGFGLFFAAPLAGYGIVRLVGPNLHRVQLGIAVAVLGFALGMSQSLFQFHVWPNSTALVDEILRYQEPNAHYLVSSDEVEIYSLRGDPDAEPAQFDSTFFFGYVDTKGQYITGDPAYTEAIAAGYFQVIAYSGTDSPAVEQMLAEELYHDPDYRLVAQIPEPTSYGPTYYYVWVHR